MGDPEAKGPEPGASPAARPYRWAVLGAYMGTSIVAQMLWLTFSSLPSCSNAVFCPSTANLALLSATFPLAYIVISLPVGHLVDARGFRVSVLVGAGLLAVSGVLRPFAPSFPVLLLFQGIGALGQPFVLNSLSKLVRTWFPEKEVATATGIGTLSIFLGLALGFGLPPVLAQLLGVKGTLEVLGGVAAGALVLFVLVAREHPLYRPPVEAPSWKEMGRMLKVRDVALLCALFFVGIGIFNSVATLIQPMLGAQGVGAADAGLLGAVLIVGGILGAVVLSVVADRYRTLRRPLLLALAGSALLWAVLGVVRGLLPEALGLLVLGFLFLATLPLGLELSVRVAGRAREGAANAIVWEFAQIGGLLFIFVFEGIGESSWGWSSLFFVSAGLTLSMLALGAAMREP